MNRIQDVEAIDTQTRTADGELLARFLSARDDAAFAEVLSRHGPMVFGVCLRRLGQCQDAEDSFQAVFLALAKHGEKLVDRKTVGPWLYTVAHQVSTKALRSRKRRRWVFWGSLPEPETKRPAEVNVDLDAALATLNEHERSAVILCHLEGLSRAEAARELGCPEGTLSVRLSRALEKLRKKLGKPPIAIFAGAMVVMLPDSLPASTMGLVHHLRDGTLDDWASPRTLDLYRKAVPMRLLDRFGPALAAVAAAVLILVGASFGWHMINAQGPEDQKPPTANSGATDRAPTQKKSFAAAVQDLQGKGSEAKGGKGSFVHLQIKAAQGKEPRFPWDIQVVETLSDGTVRHSITSWPAIEPFLRQIATDKQSIDVDISPKAVSRLEANQIMNICNRVGFKTIDYKGPELFLGMQGDGWDSDGSANPVQFQANLDGTKDDLPDWTNGWAVKEGKIHRYSDLAKDGAADLAVENVQGEFGPAFQKARENRQPREEKKEALPPTEFGKRLKGMQQTKWSIPRSVELTRNDQTGEYCVLAQRFGAGRVLSQTTNVDSFNVLATRTAKAVGGDRFDVRIAHPENAAQSTAVTQFVNPLHVNALLNALKKGGVTEIHYWGQPIFYGQGDESNGNEYPKSQVNPTMVRLVLQPQEVEGALPDETNGWRAVGTGKWDVIRVEDGARHKRAQEMRSFATPEEIVDLAKLSPAELEKVIAKKPEDLRTLFRKAVDDERSKPRGK